MPVDFYLFLFFERQGLIMLLRLASNSWPQVIFLSRSLKVPRLQVWATTLGPRGASDKQGLGWGPVQASTYRIFTQQESTGHSHIISKIRDQYFLSLTEDECVRLTSAHFVVFSSFSHSVFPFQGPILFQRAGPSEWGHSPYGFWDWECARCVHRAFVS